MRRLALPNTNTRIPGTWRSDATGAFPRLSTHGSVIGGNVRGAPVELTAGTSGYALVADDTTESGLAWASFAGSNYYVSSIAFNTSTGVLTLGRSGLGDLTQDLDGRYSTLSSPLTTKGDIWVYGSANTRLPVGTDSYALVADSSTATGLNWAANSDANYYTTSASLSAGTLTGVIAGGGSNWTADISAVATGSITSSTQYYNTFYNAATGLVGSSRLQTDGSNNIILSGASNIAKTAADFQSTLGVSGTLTVSGATNIIDTLNVTGNTIIEGTSLLSGNTTITGSLAGTTSANFGTTLTATGATTMLGGGTASGNLYVKTGSRNQMHMDPTLEAAKMVIRDSGGTADISEFMYYPRLSLEQDATDPTGPAANAGYPSIYFLKYGPSGVSSPVGGDPVGWRQVASGAAGASTAPQYMVWEYSTDMDGANFSEKLKLKNDGTLTTTTFAGALLGTIDSTTTATTQSASDNSTKVATTAYADAAAAGGGGTIGGSITDNQVAFGASTANSIEGSASFTWDGANFNITGSSPKIIVDGGGSDDASIELRESSQYGGRMYYDGDSGTFMKFTTIDGGTEKIRIAYDRYGAVFLGSAPTVDASSTPTMYLTSGGDVGIGTEAPSKKLDVRGGATFSGSIYASGSDLGGYISRTDTNEMAIYAGDGTKGIHLAPSINYLTAPSTRWQVQSDFRVNSTKQLQFGDDEHYIYSDGTDLILKTVTTATNGIILDAKVDTTFKIDGTTKMTLDADGQLGIGTTTPSFPLHLYGAATQEARIQSTDSGAYSRLQLKSHDAGYGQLLFGDSAADGAGALNYTHSSDTLDISAANAVQLSITDNLITLGDGVVLAPHSSDNFTIDSPNGIVLDGTSATNGVQYHDGGTELLRIQNSSSNPIIRTMQDSKDLIFQQFDATEVMRITDNARVGIGTTAPNAKLEILSTTEQLRLSYDGSYESKFTVDSAGVMTWTSDSTHFYKPGNGLNYFNGGSGENRLYVFDNNDSAYATYSGKYLTLRDGSANQDVYLNAEGASYFVHRVAFGGTVPLSDIGITVWQGMSLKEQGSATADTADYGQFWVKNDTPNKPYFTDDAGTDFDLTATGTAATPGGSDTQIQFNNAGAFGGVSGFTTTDDGSDIVLTSATASKPTFTITNTNADANSSFLIFNKNTASPAVGDNLGYIRFDGKDSAGGSPTYADIFAQSTNVTNLSEEGAIRFRTSTGGSMADLMILSGANVGIGVTSPDAKLHIDALSEGQGLIVDSDYSTGDQIRVLKDGSTSKMGKVTFDGTNMVVGAWGGSTGIRFWNNAEGMRLTGSNLGIGTTAPAHRLDVVGTTQLSGNSTIRGTLAIEHTNSQGNHIYTDSDGNLVLGGQSTAGTDDYVWLGDDDGNVGIGVSGTSYKLDVVGTTQLSGNAVITGTLGVTGIATLADASVLASSAAPTADAQIANKKYVDDSISTETPGGSDTQMQYNNGGAFGGASSVVYDDGGGHLKLTGTSQLQFSGSSHYIYQNGDDINIVNSAANGEIRSDAEVRHRWYINGSQMLQVDDSGDMIWMNAGSEKGRFDVSAGRLGIGTAAPNHALEVAGTIRIDNGTTDNELQFDGAETVLEQSGSAIFKQRTWDGSGYYVPILWTGTAATQNIKLHGGMTTLSGTQMEQSGSFILTNGAITSNPGTNHLWASGSTLFWGGAQIGTTTPGAGAIQGTATAGEVAYGDGSNSITSTSNFTFTDDSGMTITSATASKPVLMLKNTNADANAAELQFYKSTTDEAVNDYAGKLSFYFDNDAAQKTLGAKIYSTAQSVTDGAEGGYLYFSTMKAGTETITMTMKSGNIGFGESSPGYQYSFSDRATSDTNILIEGNDANWLWQNKTDGSLLWKQNTDGVSAMTLTSGGNLGIGTTSPTAELDVRGSSSAGMAAFVSGTGNGTYPVMHVVDSADTEVAWFEGNRAGDTGAYIGVRHWPTSATENARSGIKFQSKDDGGALTNYATLQMRVDDYTGGTEDGKLKVLVMADGTETESVNFSKNGIIIDEYTRLQRNTSTNGLYVTDSGGNPVPLALASGGALLLDNTTANRMYRTSGKLQIDTTETLKVGGALETTGKAVIGAATMPTNNGIRINDTVELPQQAGDPTNVASAGIFWVKSTSPTTPWFTASDGTDTDLTAGEANVFTGGVTDTYIPIATATDVLGDFLPAYVDLTTDKNVFLGIVPASLTASADYNTAFGYLALENLTDGSNNTALGMNAGNDLTQGYANVFVGYGSGGWKTTEARNTAVGYAAGPTAGGGDNVNVGVYAGYSHTGNYCVIIGSDAAYNTTGVDSSVIIGRQAWGTGVGTGDDNVVIGSLAGQDLTSAAQTVLIGSNAGSNLTTGTYNTVMGYDALKASVGGTYNVALGWMAMRYHAEAASGYNVSVGSKSMYNIATGTANVVLGDSAMYGKGGTLNEANVAIGASALYTASGTSNNVAVGHYSMNAATTGVKNVAVGATTLDALTTASGNTAVGYNALTTSTTAHENTAVGQDAGKVLTGQYNVIMGSSTAPAATSMNNAVVIGRQAMGGGAASGDGSVTIGFQANYSNVSTEGNTVIIGYQAGYTNGDATTSLGGRDNVLIGYKSGYNLSYSARNVAVGYNTLTNAGNNSEHNVAIGYTALGDDAGTLAGDSNIAIGSATMYRLSGASSENISIGGSFAKDSAGTVGEYNISIGSETLTAMAGASASRGNIAFGKQTLNSLTTGNYNLAIGRGALTDLNQATTNLQYNMAIGPYAGQHLQTGSNNVYVGPSAGPSASTSESNKLYIHNAAGTPLIGGDFSAGTVTIDGTLSATAKSFNIEHPLYKDKRLVHGSLEGPEHGIYIRGTIEAKEYGCEIELPEYWDAMCEDYSVQLTPHGPYTVYIKEKQKDKVMIACTNKDYKFDYYVVGSRTDETLEVVQDG